MSLGRSWGHGGTLKSPSGMLVAAANVPRDLGSFGLGGLFQHAFCPALAAANVPFDLGSFGLGGPLRLGVQRSPALPLPVFPLTLGHSDLVVPCVLGPLLSLRVPVPGRVLLRSNLL